MWNWRTSIIFGIGRLNAFSLLEVYLWSTSTNIRYKIQKCTEIFFYLYAIRLEFIQMVAHFTWHSFRRMLIFFSHFFPLIYFLFSRSPSIWIKFQCRLCILQTSSSDYSNFMLKSKFWITAKHITYWWKVLPLRRIFFFFFNCFSKWDKTINFS